MLKYSKVLAAAAIAASLGIGMTAKAATVTYTLVIGQNNGGAAGVSGQWTLFADDSVGDNFGIVAMGVGINKVLTIVNDMPSAQYLDGTGHDDGSGGTAFNPAFTSGFMALRANNPGNYPAAVPLTGSFDTTASLLFVIQGFGQTAGTMPTAASMLPAGAYDTRTNPNNGPLTWAAHLKVAHGTYDPAAGLPQIDPSVTQTAANVLTALPPFTNPTSATLQTSAATIPTPTVVNTLVVIPEPASLGVLALGGLALLARRRKTA